MILIVVYLYRVVFDQNKYMCTYLDVLYVYGKGYYANG